MKRFIFLILVLTSLITCAQESIKSKTVDSSIKSCVKIFSVEGNSSGTGFFVGKDVLITCFHVIGFTYQDANKQIKLKIFNDLKAVTESGDTIDLKCISVPTSKSLEPILKDFAILKTKKPFDNKEFLQIEKNAELKVADKILFSGYPLGTPTMITHFGLISGVTEDKSIICIQASTNKGNSGGALINEEGKVIGIVSMREGGISKGLQNYMSQITNAEKQGSILLQGVNPLQATKETISVLDKYISTGIGYARNIKYVNDYIKTKKIKLK